MPSSRCSPLKQLRCTVERAARCWCLCDARAACGAVFGRPAIFSYFSFFFVLDNASVFSAPVAPSPLLTPCLALFVSPAHTPRRCADELWHVERRHGNTPGSVTLYEGSYDEYREMLEGQFEAQGLMTGAMMAKKR